MGGVRWETQTWAGSGEGRVNEDYALVDAGACCAVLVDGATGLTKVNLVAGTSDAAWYVRRLCEALSQTMATTGLALAEALPVAGRLAADDYRLFPGADALARIDDPNGSLAALDWRDGRLTVAMLGDCTAVVSLVDGSHVVLHDDTLTQLDEQNYRRMLAYAQSHDTTMKRARVALNPRFIENRLKMNQPGGYWAADVSCDGMTHAQLSTYPLAAVRSVFSCSDGYAAAVDMGVVPDAAQLASRVEAGEGRMVGQLLREAEQADEGCWRVPRSKTSDDATYLFVCFDDVR